VTEYLITAAALLLITAAWCGYHEWEFRRFRRRLRDD